MSAFSSEMEKAPCGLALTISYNSKGIIQLSKKECTLTASGKQAHIVQFEHKGPGSRPQAAHVVSAKDEELGKPLSHV